MDLYLVRFSDEHHDDWARIAERWLVRSELERASSMRNTNARLQHLIGRITVRVACAGLLGIDPRRVAVTETPTGKPLLADPTAPNFSISHTGSLVAVAVCADAAVGVDVESEARLGAPPEKLAKRHFAKSELDAISRAAPANARAQFIRFWTVKEAVGKAIGCGIMPALSGAAVEITDHGLRLASVPDGADPAAWTLHQLTAPDGDETISLAIRAPGVALGEVVRLSMERLAAGRV